MSQTHVEVSALIDAPPAHVYAVIADYREGHHAILPKQYFAAMTVEAGGIGAGTVIEVQMNVMGAKRTLRLAVSEPEPGRVIVERDDEAGIVTSFTIDPVGDDRNQSRVTIATDAAVRPGFAGWIEKLVNPPVTRRIFREELKLLAARVQE